MSTTTEAFVGEKIRELREARGWRHIELAAATGLSPEGIRLIERGRSSPTLRTLERIAGAFGLEVHDLLPPGGGLTVVPSADSDTPGYPFDVPHPAEAVGHLTDVAA